MAKDTSGPQIVATNRQARHRYDILDTLECGIVLRGSEVRSLRVAKVTLAEAFAAIENGELWLHNLHIAPYSHSQAHSGHEPARQRKLLAHGREIDKWRSRMQTERLTLVPLRLYFSGGRAKVEVALARGRKSADRRQEIAKRDVERETRREMGRAIKGRQ